MSMTESEALKWFKGFYNGDCERHDFDETICADCNFPCRHGEPILRAISSLEEIQQYRAIGTVEELRELKEKATAKKPYYVQYDSNPNIGNWHCPTCNGIVLYYHRVCGCGQKLVWSEGKE